MKLAPAGFASVPIAINFDLIQFIFHMKIGVIRSIEPLDYEKNHNHILQVVAFDCGMKRSEPVLVSVKVNRVCRLGWTGKRFLI